MTKDEFLEIVAARGISVSSFSLGDNSNECYVLSGKGANWEVYYSERGLKTNLRGFASESDALEHLLEELTNDPTTRQHRS